MALHTLSSLSWYCKKSPIYYPFILILSLLNPTKNIFFIKYIIIFYNYYQVLPPPGRFALVEPQFDPLKYYHPVVKGLIDWFYFIPSIIFNFEWNFVPILRFFSPIPYSNQLFLPNMSFILHIIHQNFVTFIAFLAITAWLAEEVPLPYLFFLILFIRRKRMENLELIILVIFTLFIEFVSLFLVCILVLLLGWKNWKKLLVFVETFRIIIK